MDIPKKLPLSTMFPDTHEIQTDLLPKVLAGISNEQVRINFTDFMSVWLRRDPSAMSQQECVEVIGARMTPDLMEEVFYSAKLALIAYAMPFYFGLISTNLHVKNVNFLSDMAEMNEDAIFRQGVFAHMDQIISSDITEVPLPNDNQVAGYYIRTPIRIWNKQRKRVFKIPSWRKRESLLHHLVVGNVNVYVIRKNLKTGFEIYVLFRGTSNEFNGVPQYGSHFSNTQIYHVPDFNIETQTFYKQGSEHVPLFYFYYCNMILDVKQYIYRALEHLKVESAERVLIVGHSMGAGLAITFAYASRFDKPEWWDKFQFRMFAAPLCCNDAAVRSLEKIIQQSKTKHKFVEVINRDDIANVQHMFGGHAGFLQSLQGGTSAALAWIIKESHREKLQDDQMIENALRIVQLHPDTVGGIFLNKASEHQLAHMSTDLRTGFRLGQRKSEIRHWGSYAMDKKYNTTLNVVYCSRRYRSEEEYLGSSHNQYANLTMGTFWSVLRRYENELYEHYAKNGIRKRNRLCIIPMFSEIDMPKARNLDFDVKPWEPSRDIMTQFFSQ